MVAHLLPLACRSYSIECSFPHGVSPTYVSHDHENLKNVAIPLLLLWPVGVRPVGSRTHVGHALKVAFSVAAVSDGSRPAQVPLIFFALLSYERHAQYAPLSLSNSVRFLNAEYVDSCYYWEVLEILRKEALCGFLMLIPQHLNFLRIVIGVCAAGVEPTTQLWGRAQCTR